MSLIIQNLATMQQKVIPGIDSFLQTAGTGNKLRYAIVTNDAAKTLDGTCSRVQLLKAGFNLIKIFSPEHGISVNGEDGVFQKNSTDAVTGLPVISLYSGQLAPAEEDLQDIDVVLFDIPDVGCRFYTYLWTMTCVMEACASFNKKFVVLDRPNPTGGDLSMAEGPMLDEKNCSSFIGRWSIPVRHCCTLGELARYFSAIKVNGLDVKVIPVKNWKRNQMAGADGFDFFPTSPAIKNISAALLYPGTGLLEGINVNEGRGTDNPFVQFGAPWIHADKLQTQLVQKKIPGITTRSCSYVPADGLYKREICNGIGLAITDGKRLLPVALGIYLLKTLVILYPADVKERLYKTNANPSGAGHLDKLLGISNAFQLIRSGTIFQTDVSGIWREQITPYLLYV